MKKEKNERHENIHFEKLHQHLKDGYLNAQSVIRFIDTKTNIIMGLCASILTIVLGVLLKSELNFPVPYLKCIFYIMSIAFLIFSFFVLLYSVFSLTARPPIKPIQTILFPFIVKGQEGNASEYYNQFLTLNSNAEDLIIKEYNNQLYNVGLILAEKFLWHKKAVISFIIQIILVIVLIFLVLSCNLINVKNKSDLQQSAPAGKHIEKQTGNIESENITIHINKSEINIEKLETSKINH